ncbi:MAG TPA: electron transfer flavoprotein subunit beta/FixA family protein [Candidatus Thermoplasmatota archaeon]|nr:electron transfer flavoprotein subunit beta/FixA family protein [Candidatus Thermoplasmatota archaeon]
MKQTPDVEAIRVDPKTGAPDLGGVGVKVSDYDKNAVEAAVQIKEKNVGSKVTAVSLGGPKLEESMKEVLAMGCDDALLLRDEKFTKADTAEKARLLAAAVKKLGDVELVLAAEESADSHSGQTGPRVAEHLGWPLLSYATDLKFANGTVTIEREGENGIEVLEAKLPVVVTVTDALNTPRLPALMQILQAKNKPQKVMTAADLGAPDVTVKVDRPRNVAPKSERKQQMIAGNSPEEAADNLAKLLVKDGVVS